MRIFLFVAFILSLAACGLTFVSKLQAKTMETVPIRAADALDSIGITTHLNYLDTSYAQIDKTSAALSYLGVTHLRDLTPPPEGASTPRTSTYLRLAKEGRRFDFVVFGGNFDPARPVRRLAELATLDPRAVEAIEGFNEIDHSPVTFRGQTGDAAAISAQKELYAAVRANSALKSVPVYDLTGLPTPDYPDAQRADYANTHLYPQNGLPPDPWFRGYISLLKVPRPKIVATEFGYASLEEKGWLVVGVGELGQAKGVLSGIFSGLENGFKRTYIYELLDERPDPSLKDRENHYGLFSATFRPKLAARALQHLTRWLSDPSDAASHFSPKPFSMELVNMPGTGHAVVIAKSNGERLVAVWNELAFWDHMTAKHINNASAYIQVGVPTGWRASEILDPIAESVITLPDASRQKIDVDLTDYPRLIRMTPR